jgi:hypothetical protein
MSRAIPQKSLLVDGSSWKDLVIMLIVTAEQQILKQSRVARFGDYYSSIQGRKMKCMKVFS